MSDCKYPHRITIAMTDDLYKGLKTQISIKKMVDDLCPEVSEQDLICLMMVHFIEKNDTSTPIYLRSMREVKAAKEAGEDD
jgi:hypothetical protein